MMTTNRKSYFIWLIVLAGVVVMGLLGGVVWAITAANSSEESQTPTDNSTSAIDATPPQSPSHVTTQDEESLALEATEIMTTWTPSEDRTQTAAELRASHLMTDELANRLQEPQRATGGEDWRQAQDTNATSHPTVEIAEGTEEGMVTVSARWQWVEGNGSNSWWPDERRAYHFTFTQENGELRIHDYTYETLRR